MISSNTPPPLRILLSNFLPSVLFMPSTPLIIPSLSSAHRRSKSKQDAGMAALRRTTNWCKRTNMQFSMSRSTVSGMRCVKMRLEQLWTEGEAATSLARKTSPNMPL